ncbi:MAG: ABC transporter permease [Anaerolineae bacterium]|jgi:ABC-type Na+ efflux pump permease subunit|nr:ABC transporter permease [Anaerolineae bacterium]
MRKILTIAWKDVVATFTDRNLVLLMVAAPLAISTIIGVTFGGVAQGSSAPLTDIPVAVVNLDEGTGGTNYGAIIAGVLAPLPDGQAETAGFGAPALNDAGLQTAQFVCPDSSGAPAAAGSLDELLEGARLTSAAEARAGVEAGTYAAAVIIPSTFSADIGFTPTDMTVSPTRIEVYADPERPISSSIIRSIVQQVGAQIAVGNVTLSALFAPITDQPLRMISLSGSQAFAEGVSCAFSGVGSPITVVQETVEGDAFVFNPLVVFGSAQALFFAIFTANGSANSTIEERKNGTLQRMAITPTPMLSILTGKLLATFINVLVQLLFLMVALTLVNTLIQGRFEFIWGNNPLMVLLITVASAIGATGIGAITAAAARNSEQAATFGSIIAIFSAVLGGAFGFQLGGGLQNLSIVYWGSNAYTLLANNNTDVWLNALVLTVFGAVTFAIGFIIFARRLRD